MIDRLLELGLTVNDIQNIKDFIREEDQEDMINNIQLLENIGCDKNSIKNIIVGNPSFLQRSYSDVYKLISYLQQLGFTYINLLLDSYPSFLNKDAFEIRDFINRKLSDGESLEDIIDEIDSNPMIIDEE